MSLDLDEHSFVSKYWKNNTIHLNINEKKLKVSIDSDNLIKFNIVSENKSNGYNEDCDDLKEIITIFEENKINIYLEWTDKYTAEYKYYNLNHIINQLQTLSISPNNFYKYSFIKIIKYQDLDLNINDIMILSKMRDLFKNNSYSFMGKFNFNNEEIKIYIGEWPKIKYMKKLDISITINCCKGNVNEIKNFIKEEIKFDVANWKLLLIEEIEQFKKTNKKLNKSKNLKILDKLIDEINNKIIKLTEKKNIYIHCHAGMHRSPFIFGCYLLKYGGFLSKSIYDIYNLMKSKRECVQEMGYDKTMEHYKQYLTLTIFKQTQNCVII